MAMHLTFNKTSLPMPVGDTAQVSAETFDGLKLAINDVRKKTLDPVTTDEDGNEAMVSVYKALVKHHPDIAVWSDGYPMMTGNDFAVLYNHVLDLLRKIAFEKAQSFRILRMRDACFTPPSGVDAPTTSRDAFAMMVSRAPRYPRCSHSFPPAATPDTIRRLVQVVPEAQLEELRRARYARAGGRAAQDAQAPPLAARPAQVRGRRGQGGGERRRGWRSSRHPGAWCAAAPSRPPRPPLAAPPDRTGPAD